MITRTGKRIMSKYLLGINPAFATHIAIGCGANPLLDSDLEPTSNSWRKNLEFESARAVIMSRGLVNEDGLESLVFKAELPHANRYGITEVGLYCGGVNARASQFDSKPISSFNAPTELWYLVDNQNSISPLEVIGVDPTSVTSNDIEFIGYGGSSIKLAYLSSGNALWTDYPERETRKEQPRNGNGCVLVRGDYSDILYDPDNGWSSTNTYGIETSSLGGNFVKNSPEDEIRLAFSVVSKNKTDTTTLPANTSINIWLEFVNNYSNTSKKFAKAKVSIGGGSIIDSRYCVHNFKLSDFVLDEGFSWAAVNGIRIFSSVQVVTAVSDSYFILYDGLRLENISTESPTYGMVAYTQAFSEDGQPFIKTENTNNFIEFRLLVEDL